ncbi:MAG: hypothetical protein OEO21_11775 [Candidatus Krumholzibacteria bacterium]|nr:hypothetical protein [Candidatus Krumholzibacteria bacterium]
MKRSSFQIFMHVLYGVGLGFVVVAAFIGVPYYATPLSERPHVDMHTAFKPGGVWSHGLGVVGSAMILLLLLYSARKRGTLGLRFGRLSRWLDVHIFFGVMGPLLITLHTAFKLNGIVTVSYVCMMVTALSGIFGRYVYMQIPRDTRGHALDLRRAGERLVEVRARLQERFGLDAPTLREVDRYAGAAAESHLSGTRTLFASLGADLAQAVRTRRLRRALRARKSVPRAAIDEVVGLAREQSLLTRRIAIMDTMTWLLHFWHVFHRPFAYIMIAIMFVHVAVAVTFGYRWVF